ncbi:MAG: glycosyltransferase family 2 protein [Candidatus Shapirobacteria bacterium]|jgi:cellulose synthase/poly-beta-1,6-N-acetylglucosamine synthase-like glycosyltransferase
MKNQVAILIPAYNEELVIESTLSSAVALVGKNHVYVVNDGSTDSTASCAKSYTPNILSIPNGGKANALNSGIRHFQLTDYYKYIFLMDADTRIDPHFLQHALPHLKSKAGKKLNGVVGKVCSLGVNWIGKFRIWEYEIAHSVHKRAQSNTNTILVLPGCATLYRSRVFKKFFVPLGTLTEDMDFTFELNRQNQGNFVYEERSLVITQDPRDLRSFLKQIKRWYIGFWQCVHKHHIPWGGQNIDLEVALLATEGLFNGFISLALLFTVPMVLFVNPLILVVPFLFDLFLFFLPTLIWTAATNRNLKLFFYLPHFYFLRLLLSLVFIYTFFVSLLKRPKSNSWTTERYSLTQSN